MRAPLRQGADAAVCTHVSNVYGNVLPVSAIAALCRERGVPLVIDASQSAGTLPVRLHGTGAAFIAMPGHRLLWPCRERASLWRGWGAGWAARGSNSLDQSMPDFLPDRHEAGTHNVCGIGGLLAGLRFVRSGGRKSCWRRSAHSRPLRRGLRQLPGVEVFTGPGQSGVLSFRCRDLDCEGGRRLSGGGRDRRAGRAALCADGPPQRRNARDRNGPGELLCFNTSAEVRQFLQVCRTAFLPG